MNGGAQVGAGAGMDTTAMCNRWALTRWWGCFACEFGNAVNADISSYFA